MDNIKNILIDRNLAKEKILKKAKYVTKEYQDYGYRIALKLEDIKRVSLYIKLAKEKPRVLLEKAYSFAIDYPNAKNRSKLFMWKIKQIESESKEKAEERKSVSQKS